MRDNVSEWSPCDSIASSDRLVDALIEREEYELAVLVQQWVLQSKRVTLEALVSTRKTFRLLAGSSGGLGAARPQLDKIIQWLEDPANCLEPRQTGVRTDRISLLALTFVLEFTSLLKTKADALDSYFKNLPFERRDDFERELTNLERMDSAGDIDREAFSRIMDSARQKYSSWESDLKSQICNSVSLQVKNSPKQNLGCLAGGIWFIVLSLFGSWAGLHLGRGTSAIPPFFPMGVFLGAIILGILSANTIRSFRRHKMARELLKTGLDRQNKEFEDLGLPQISAPNLIIRSPGIDLAICAGIAIAFLVGLQLFFFGSTRPSSAANIGTQPYNGKGIEDHLAGRSVGNAYGIQWINANGDRGAVFSAAASSRIEYPGFIPPQGTLEFWIKVESGYQYVDYVFKRNQDVAMIFSSDVQGGDVTWPGTTKVSVNRNGDLSLWMATVKGPNKVPPTEARATKFGFGQWHAIGVSYGSQGQYIMLDGKLVASAPGRTQTFGEAGTQESPLDIPTIGETVSHFWQHHRYEGGFEGVLAAFRVSGKQLDWDIAKGITQDNPTGGNVPPTQASVEDQREHALVQHATELLASHDFDGALAACNEALTLNAGDLAAVQLKKEIQDAMKQSEKGPNENTLGTSTEKTDGTAISLPPPGSNPPPIAPPTSNTPALESGSAPELPTAPVLPTSRPPFKPQSSIPAHVEIREDADRRGTLTLFPDHIEYRDEGMGSNGGHAPYGPNPDNNFVLSCGEILSIKAYGFRPVLFGSYQVVITARSGKYHIPTLHSQPIVQGIQNRCGVGTGDSIQKQ